MSDAERREIVTATERRHLRFRAWWERCKERLNRPMEECPHCGHPWGLGLDHDDAACEMKRLRQEITALRAEVTDGR